MDQRCPTVELAGFEVTVEHILFVSWDEGYLFFPRGKLDLTGTEFMYRTGTLIPACWRRVDPEGTLRQQITSLVHLHGFLPVRFQTENGQEHFSLINPQQVNYTGKDEQGRTWVGLGGVYAPMIPIEEIPDYLKGAADG